MSKTWMKIRKIQFPNPILGASGTFGFGLEFKKYVNLNKIGGFCTKGITVEPREGNSGERIFETEAGLLNSIGLENPGLIEFQKEYIPRLEELKTNVFINVAGHNFKDYEKIISTLTKKRVAGFEVNVSCPNLAKGGEIFGRRAKTVKDLCKLVRDLTNKVVIFKLSPEADDIIKQSIELEKAGVDAVTIANTYPGLALNSRHKPYFKKIFAGLSGPAIKPLTMRLVWQISDKISIPVIASGGVTDFRDILDYLAAGASLVQVGTGNFIQPEITGELVKKFDRLNKKRSFSFDQFVGSAKKKE